MRANPLDGLAPDLTHVFRFAELLDLTRFFLADTRVAYRAAPDRQLYVVCGALVIPHAQLEAEVAANEE